MARTMPPCVSRSCMISMLLASLASLTASPKQRLPPAEHGGHPLVGLAQVVVLGLRRVQRSAAGEAPEPEQRRRVGGRAVALTHDRGPPTAARPVFGDLLEEVPVGIEEEGDLGR